MSKYDNEYFFIRVDDDQRTPYLKPDTNMNERRFRNKVPQVNSAPFIFTNAWKDDFRKAGIKEKINDVLFESSLFLVRDVMRERLLRHEIPAMFLHPAVYIDDSDEWHEDYWFMGFTDRFDCWDRSSSTYKVPPLKIGVREFYSMYSYSLDEQVLTNTPLANRLLFQIGGTQDAMVVCHESIAPIFRENGRSGVVLQPIKDY